VIGSGRNELAPRLVTDLAALPGIDARAQARHVCELARSLRGPSRDAHLSTGQRHDQD
jgi:hypothetical protein